MPGGCDACTGAHDDRGAIGGGRPFGPAECTCACRGCGEASGQAGVARPPQRLISRTRTSVAFAIKAEVRSPRAKTFAFTAQKTMYGGKHIAKGDAVFVFASENEGGQGLIARGVVTASDAIARKRGVLRQTPRMSITVKRTALAKRPVGRSELRRFAHWKDGRPETEL